MGLVASRSLNALQIESQSVQGHLFFYKNNNRKCMGSCSASATATRDWVTVPVL